MRFLLLHHYRVDGHDSFRAMNGSVFFDVKGNRYFRADHMSQGAHSEHEVGIAADQLASHPDCIGWELQVFPEARDFADLINKLRPIHPNEYLATLSP